MRQDKAIQYLKVAHALAQEFSKDPSTKVSCTFIDPEDYTELTRGFNGMPRGIDETRKERFERPLKYDFFEHAERNAIYNLARRFLLGSMAITTTSPNVGCVRGLLSVGASFVVVPAEVLNEPAWQVSGALLREAGVKVLVSQDDQVVDPEPPGPFEMQTNPEVTPRFLRKASQHLAYAKRRTEILSKDPQGGAAVFVSPTDFTILAEGYSGMPRKANDAVTHRYTGPERELWVEPAVRNAIYNVVRPLLKGSVAVVTAPTCVECVRAVSAVGASRVVYSEPSADFISRWGESMQAAQAVREELNLPAQPISEKELQS